MSEGRFRSWVCNCSEKSNFTALNCSDGSWGNWYLGSVASWNEQPSYSSWTYGSEHSSLREDSVMFAGLCRAESSSPFLLKCCKYRQLVKLRLCLRWLWIPGKLDWSSVCQYQLSQHESAGPENSTIILLSKLNCYWWPQPLFSYPCHSYIFDIIFS